jgi:hypothetical protein
MKIEMEKMEREHKAVSFEPTADIFLASANGKLPRGRLRRSLHSRIFSASVIHLPLPSPRNSRQVRFKTPLVSVASSAAMGAAGLPAPVLQPLLPFLLPAASLLLLPLDAVNKWFLVWNAG